MRIAETVTFGGSSLDRAAQIRRDPVALDDALARGLVLPLWRGKPLCDGSALVWLPAAHPALAEELRIVDQQAEVGSLPQALKNFGQRIDSPEINSFTSLLVQSESTGTSISKALTEYSDSIRASLKERADARANAASFKLLFPVALFLMPSVFLFLLGPAIVQMSDFFNNQAETLQQNRQDAVRSLDQQPQLDLRRFGSPGGAFSGPTQ